MNLKIKNIGIVKQADVRLDGLTVIAGENDTGKSTVGKLMFAIVKAVSRYEQDLNESKENEIRRIIEEIFLYIRRTKDSANENLFFMNVFFNELIPFIRQNNSDLTDTEKKKLNEIFDKRIKIIYAKADFLQLKIIIIRYFVLYVGFYIPNFILNYRLKIKTKRLKLNCLKGMF